MKAPQVIMIAWFAADLALYLVLHGTTKPKRYSFWYELIGIALFAGLLYWGGFWSC